MSSSLSFSGLSHGANWNFIIWAAYHGVLLVLWRLISKGRPGIEEPFLRVSRLAQWGLIFVLTNIGWLIFREQTPAYLWQFITQSPFSVPAEEWRLGLYMFAFAGIYSLPLWLHGWTDRWCTGDENWAQRQTNWRCVIALSAVGALMLIAILLLKTETASDFIYFQF